jgi:hypothetical protein
MSSKQPPTFLITERQRALCAILSEAGIRESGTGPDGRPYADSPPEGQALMLDMALSAGASEDHIVDILAWGHLSDVTAQTRALARDILALRDGPPA